MLSRILLLLLGAAAPAWAAGASLSPVVTVDAADPARLLVTVTVADAEARIVTDGERALTVVGLPGAFPSLVRGEPDLPILPVALVIPDEGDPVVRVVSARWREQPLTAPVRPSRGNLPRTVRPADEPLVFGAAYAGGIHPAAVVVAGRPYVLRDVRALGLSLRPVRWDVDRGVLLVLQEMVLEVTTTGRGGVNARTPGVGAPAAGFAGLHARRFANPPAADKYRALPTGGRMLVVVPAAFAGAVGEFLQWKRERGYEPLLLTVEQAGGTAAAIRDSVQARFAEPAGLDYVLLVGDVPLVPGFKGLFENADDDTRYAQVAGDDLYPDLFVSRISARDLDELRTQLVKLVAYERDPEPGGAWYAHAAGAASNQGVPTDAQRADGLRAALLEWTFTDVDRIYEPDATGAMIAAALNEGRSLLNYLGHGSGTSWSNPLFTTADVHALANGSRLPWIVDVSCANGRFSDPECFAEAWLRTGTADAPAGAIAMYSASTTTPWVPPTVMQEEAMALLAGGLADEIGAICQQGIMKVLDVYPGDEGRQLVEQYNIFGDCSLQVRTAVPLPLAVRHQGSLAVGVDVFPVDAGVAGARVAITSPGVLHGTAVTDASGYAAVPLTLPATAAGSVVLTVTGRNLLTHRETVAVTVPVTATVTTAPAPLVVGQGGRLEVALSGAGANLGLVDVTLEGWGVDALPVRVDASGTALFPGLEPRFGETLRLSGRRAADRRLLFQIDVPVTGGAVLGSARIEAGTAPYGMVDRLAPGVAGTVGAGAGEAGLELRVVGCGIDRTFTTPDTMLTAAVLPDSTGVVTVALLKDGREAFVRQVPVVEALGTVGGRVTGAGDGLPLHGARVTVRDAAGRLVFAAVSDGQGWWRHEPDLPAGECTVSVSQWGYLDAEESRMLQYGANDWRTALVPAPREAAAGLVTSETSGLPLRARVEVRRAADRGLVATVTADAAGRFATPPLPVGSYLADCTLNGYVPRLAAFDVVVGGSPATIVLTPVAGSVLVVDANLQPGVPHAFPQRVDKQGIATGFAYTVPPAGSGLAMVAALSSLGYAPAYQPGAMIDPGAWAAYDLVVFARGDHPDPLPTPLRDALLARVAAGGRVLAEGGDLAAAHRHDGPFLNAVLGVAAWAGDRGDTVDVATAGHVLSARPAPIYGILDAAVRGYADGDALVPTAAARVAAQWNDGTAAAVALDPDPSDAAGLAVHLGFAWNLLDVAARDRLLQNAVEWLLHPEAADARLAGRALLGDGSPAAGAVVWLEPGGRSATADAGGGFVFTDLVGGEYRLGASAAGALGAFAPLAVAAGAAVAAPDLVLGAAVDTVLCGGGGAIPDGAAAGLASEIVVDDLGAVGGVRVRVDWEHPWAGDVRFELTAPSGRTVLLRQADGVPGVAASGWYEGDLAPAGDLRLLLGEPTAGAWSLRASDLAGGDAGAVEGWCLELWTAPAPVGPGDGPPRVLALLGNHPNPFNPDTTVRIAVPRAGRVVLTVHDLRGRRVRTLVDAELAAAVHEIPWDGADGAGRSVASGTYLLRLAGPGGAAAAKVMLLR